MATVDLQQVQRGWKVFAKDQEIGNVIAVGQSEITVEKGGLVRHEYRIPGARVAEAADGVVDLAIDPNELASYEAPH